MISATPIERLRRRAAFTLIELTIVVFIMAAMMAIMVPVFSRSYRASELSAAARTFVTSCQLARLNAVMHQRECLLHMDLDRQIYWLTQIVPIDELDQQDAILKTVELSPRVTLYSAETGEEQALQKGQLTTSFYPNGTSIGLTVAFVGVESKDMTAVSVDPITGQAISYEVKK